MNFDGKVRAFVPAVALGEAYAALKRRLKRHLFYARFAAYPALDDADKQPVERPRVLVAIVHITSAQEHADRAAASVKIERLAATLDGLLCSFAHCRLEVLVYSMKGRHVVAFLPEYQRRMVEVVEVEDIDPMFIGFAAQDGLVERRAAHDWFMFIEDDIEIRDSAFLDKVARFCAQPGMERCVLMPNRFEYVEGSKYYIDLTHQPENVHWNALSMLRHDGNVFAECSIPHSGMFMLSRQQIEALRASGRDWRGLDIYAGSRESAATYSLMECFTIYKPHRRNLCYLEVRHVDTRYSIMHKTVRAYVFSAIDAPAAEEVAT